MTHITIDGINNRPHAPQPAVSLTQSFAAGIALVTFVLAILAWVAS